MARAAKNARAAAAAREADLIRPISVVVAACCVASGVWRIAKQGQPDQDALLFFLGGLVSVLADSIAKLKFGGLELELVRRQVAELADVSRSGGFEAAAPPAPPSPRPAAGDAHANAFANELAAASAPLENPGLRWDDDPLSTLQAPHETASGAISARVRLSDLDRSQFTIDIAIAIAPQTVARAGTDVALLLHHSFPNPVRRLDARAGTANVSLLSAGSFTIAAVLPDGTLLKLDLASEADLGAMPCADQARFRVT